MLVEGTEMASSAPGSGRPIPCLPLWGIRGHLPLSGGESSKYSLEVSRDQVQGGWGTVALGLVGHTEEATPGWWEVLRGVSLVQLIFILQRLHRQPPECHAGEKLSL